MKTKLVFAAASLLLLSNGAQARHEFCDRFSTSMLCDDFFNDDFEHGDFVGPRGKPNKWIYSCRAVARHLSGKGYRELRATDCDGLLYRFFGRRKGRTYEIRVYSPTLEIKWARPVRR